MHKKNIILSVGIALILTTIFVWVREEKMQIPSESSQIQDYESGDSKTYSNEKYSVESNNPSYESKENESEANYSITPTSGSVGSKVVIKGGNLDTVLQQGGVWIEDAETNRGKGFIALQSKESNGSQIVVTIPASAPRQISAPQGVALKAPFEITPGNYNFLVYKGEDIVQKIPFKIIK